MERASQAHEQLHTQTHTAGPYQVIWTAIEIIDSARAQAFMESLLAIIETGSKIAIVAITGVPTVDTVEAQHLMKTVAAARLMGMDCILSGIRPQIAPTIVHLAIDLGGVSHPGCRNRGGGHGTFGGFCESPGRERDE